MAEGRDAFYVGYKPRPESSLARWLRRRIAVVIVAMPILALALVLAQGAFDEAVFEYGTVAAHRGGLVAAPYPLLLDPETGDPRLLVAFGKRGAAEEVEDLVGRRVELDGTRIYRDDQEMIEIAAGSVSPSGGGAVESSPARSHGEISLVGEIVDSKCYLGVMKPGRGKAHRACASRCISGGVPPVFLVVDDTGERHYLLLVGRDGRELNHEVSEFIAEPLAVAGEVSLRDGLWYLAAEPSEFVRVEG